MNVCLGVNSFSYSAAVMFFCFFFVVSSTSYVSLSSFLSIGLHSFFYSIQLLDSLPFDVIQKSRSFCIKFIDSRSSIIRINRCMDESEKPEIRITDYSILCLTYWMLSCFYKGRIPSIPTS